MWTATLALLVSLATAAAECPVEVHATPHIRTAVGAVVFEGERYPVRSPSEIEAFKSLLTQCGLEQTIPDFLAWRRNNERSKSLLGWGVGWSWLCFGAPILAMVPGTFAAQSVQRVRFATKVRFSDPLAEQVVD